MARHSVLKNHPGRYRLRLIDAMCPEKLLHDVGLPDDSQTGVKPQAANRPIRAVFLNYLLDCLPAAVLQFDGDEVKELHVRTCVARNVNLAEFTDMSLAQLRERAKSSDPRARQELLEVYGVFASEYDYRAVDVTKIPYGEIGVESARSLTKRFLLSHEQPAGGALPARLVVRHQQKRMKRRLEPMAQKKIRRTGWCRGGAMQRIVSIHHQMHLR